LQSPRASVLFGVGASLWVRGIFNVAGVTGPGFSLSPLLLNAGENCERKIVAVCGVFVVCKADSTNDRRLLFGEGSGFWNRVRS
jgi:hypothetical protein